MSLKFPDLLWFYLASCVWGLVATSSGIERQGHEADT